MKFAALLITVSTVLACSAEPPPWAATPVAADLILTNARIYSLSWPDPLPSGELSGSAPHVKGWAPDAQALAIKDGNIVFVGSHRQAAAWRGDQTRAIDLRGATVIPGLIDSHTHVFQLGRALNRPGLSAHSDVPSAGEMRAGDDGEPDGLFMHNAVDPIAAGLPAVSAEQLTRNALAGLQRMVADGYVGIHDAGLNAAEMAVLEQLERSGRLPIRVYAMLSLREEDLARQWLQRGPDLDADSMLVTRSVNAYYDGALGSRGARLLEDYSDKPGQRGVSAGEYGFDQALTAAMMEAGFQVGIHATGDAANREALGFLRTVMQANPQLAKGRHRIEHAQVIQAADMTTFGEQRIIASMQAPRAVEDMAWAEHRLGSERIKGAYAWRTLRQKGAMLIFNSATPGSDHNIFYGLHAALTRKDRHGQPHFGWYPEQRLNMDEAIRAYTRWPAFASFRNQLTGVIKPGRWADLTVLDIDPFLLSESDPGALLQGKILMTIVAGEIVHDQR